MKIKSLYLAIPILVLFGCELFSSSADRFLPEFIQTKTDHVHTSLSGQYHTKPNTHGNALDSLKGRTENVEINEINFEANSAHTETAWRQ
ncbi:MAG: hypothetical protein ACPGJS_15955 [Flammeovirgaceae bacterium]